MKNALFLCITYALISGTTPQTPPFFTDSVTAPEIEEGNYTGTPRLAFTLKASVHEGTVTIEVLTGDSESYVFVNNSQNGKEVDGYVYVNSVLDREMHQDIRLFFIARSDNPNAPTTNRRVTLYIKDTNDESPVFHPPSYQVLIPEDYAVNNVVHNLNIKATDPDNGAGGTVNYYIEPTGQAGNLYKGYFDINNQNGIVTLRKELDYETLTFLQYKITARDGAFPFHNSTAELLVKVEDVQDKEPRFQGLPYMKTIPENTRGFIFQVTAVDGDLGIPRPVEYGLLNGSCSGYIDINTTSGKIKVVKSLDRDTGSIHEVQGVCFITVEAFEFGVSKTNLTRSTTDLTLTIKDVNDNPPTFLNQSYIGNISENAVGIPISFSQNIQVEDIDQNGNNRIHLAVYNTNMSLSHSVEASPHEILGNGIVLLRVIKGFDFEEVHMVELVVKAVDAENNSLFSTCNVTVNIVDTNDNDPKFEKQKYNLSVIENSCKGAKIGSINATDKDSGQYGQITYVIKGYEDSFEINDTSGQIFVSSEKSCRCTNISCEESDLNIERFPVYYLTVDAIDGGGKRSSVPVVITLIDENDNNPRFRYLSYQVSIQENSTKFSSGEESFTVEALDEDEGNSNNSRVSYCVVDEDDYHCTNHAHFKMEENGTITCIKELDFEELPPHPGTNRRELVLKIMVYDFGTPSLNSTINVTINIEDKNDNEPIFNTSHDGHIEENSPSGTYILTVSAYDADGTAPNNEISYFIFSGGSDQFKMDGNSGNISVQIGARLDRESVSNYNMTVIAIDRGNPQKTGTTNVTVMVDDVNDTPPEFLNLPAEVEVDENGTNYRSIFYCDGVDKDSNSKLMFYIEVEEVYLVNGMGNHSDLSRVKNYFTVNHTTGDVYASEKIDAERETRFVLIVTVNDTTTGKPYTGIVRERLSVNITDKDDNPPIFSEKSFFAGILRTSQFGTQVFDLKENVIDKDLTAKNRVHKFYMTDINTDGLHNFEHQDITTLCKKVFCVTENGTVQSNYLFSDKGYVGLRITVNDTAGFDTATLDIYVFDESQQLSIHFRLSKNDVNNVKKIVLEKLSEVIDYTCVFDQIDPYQDDNGNVIEHESLLKFHVLDEKQKKVLEAVDVERLLDQHGDELRDLRNNHAVVSIGALQIHNVEDSDSKLKETYILVAIIVLLTLILGIVVYFYIISNTRFKRKLKAATISTTEKKNKENLGNAYIPGSNVFSSTKNPLIDKEDEVKRTIDELDRASLAGSENSLDQNEVEYAKRLHDNDDPDEEKEVVLEMYGEDGEVPNGMDDQMASLQQALQQHQNSIHSNGDMLNVVEGKVNESYQIVEATDV